MSSTNDGAVSRSEVKQKLVAANRHLKKNRKLVWSLCLAGAIAGFLVSIFYKPVYSAISTFVLEEKSPGGAMGSYAAYAGIASQFGVSLGEASQGGIFHGDNIIELYKSRRMLKKTLLTPATFGNRQMLLINRYIQVEGLTQKFAKEVGERALNFSASPNLSIWQDSVISVVIDRINKKELEVFKPDKKLNIINVVVTSNDQIFAKSFNETLVENVNQFYINTKLKNSLHNIAVIKYQLDSVRALLNKSLYGVANSVDAAPNANPFNLSLKVPAQRRQVDVQTNGALYTELVKNLAMAEVSMREEEPLIQTIDSPELPLERFKVGKVLGVVAGTAIGFFLACLFLVVKRLFA